MWVRSQNKIVLLDAICFQICGIEPKITISCYPATNEKALKVMDMLQKNINYSNYDGEDIYGNPVQKRVFKFPKDEEVEL